MELDKSVDLDLCHAVVRSRALLPPSPPNAHPSSPSTEVHTDSLQAPHSPEYVSRLEPVHCSLWCMIPQVPHPLLSCSTPRVLFSCSGMYDLARRLSVDEFRALVE